MKVTMKESWLKILYLAAVLNISHTILGNRLWNKEQLVAINNERDIYEYYNKFGGFTQHKCIIQQFLKDRSSRSVSWD